MKKLICLLAAFMILFTACGEKNTPDTTNDAQNGVVEDNDGIIDENSDSEDNIVEDAADGVADGATDIVDGVADATKDVADGAGNAVRDMTGENKNNNSTNSMK